MKTKQLLLTLLTLLGSTTLRAYDAVIDGIAYNFSGDEAEVTMDGDYSNDVVIPESVTYNGITYRVTSIGVNAFNNCFNLTTVLIPNSVTSIGAGAFYYCTNLTSVTIPSNVTSICSATFQYCGSLTSITIPNSVTSIETWAFSFCTSLTSISIPESVESIDWAAFENCTGLRNVYCYAEEVPTGVHGGAFEGVNMKVAKLHVPPTSVEAYSSTEPWSNFKNIVSIESYALTYMVDDEEYKSYEIMEGKTIVPEEEPTKEGYTFSGWSEIPDRMPAEDVVVTGSFTINSYTLTYIVDGEEYKTETLEYNSAITPEEEPTKEGCTFSGWNDLPETMPAHDVTVTGTFGANSCTIVFNTDGGSPIACIFGEAGSEITPPEDPTREGYTFLGWEPTIPETMPEEGLIVVAQWQINSYTLLYIVDEEEYKRDTLEYNTPIIPEEEPAKEGYTFSGWSEIPETMPAEDVTVTGSFTINSYNLTYFINDEEYKSFTLVYGSEIVPEEEPTREGYTFSGWSEIPETMPAHDVIVTGTFTGISYTITFIVDGEVYKTDSIPYGTPLASLEVPTKEGYTFSGWSDMPETMPAEDIVVAGTFTINQYLLIYVIDGEEYKSYEVDYDSAITPEPAPTKKGMTFSGWGEMPETMPAHDVTIIGTFDWAKEIVDGIVYQVTDTLSNYASVVGYDETSEEVTILSDVSIGEDVYTVNSIEDEALPKTTTINISVGKLLLWLWANGYESIRETESGRDLAAPEVSLAAATASSLTLSYVNDYPEFSETMTISDAPVEKGENGYAIKLTGLEPDNLYEGIATLTLTYEDVSYTKSCSFSTAPLVLTTLEPKVISEGNVIVAAESNLDDDETNVGFLWRRTAWEDDEDIFPSRSGLAYLYEGTMEGIIRNLNNNPWKVRPFYTSATGNTYYGKWRGIDPSDYSYFEPTVHTYAALAVTDSTAEVKGYAMQGTDDVESQGFMYWEDTPSASSRRKVNGVPADATIVEVPGYVMKTTLEGLDYDTEYRFVAFIKTKNGETFYGEQQSFRTTFDPDGIIEIKSEELRMKNEGVWYSLDGKKLAKPQKGINIIRYSDGTSKKVLVK